MCTENKSAITLKSLNNNGDLVTVASVTGWDILGTKRIVSFLEAGKMDKQVKLCWLNPSVYTVQNGRSCGGLLHVQ